MKVMKWLFRLVVLLPLALILVPLAVANRHMVTLALDPVSPQNPVFEVSLPLYIILFATLLIGIFVGGFMAWLKQGHHRRAAREKSYEAKKWRSEADRQQKRVEEIVEKTGTDMPALPAPTPGLIKDDAAKPAV